MRHAVLGEKLAQFAEVFDDAVVHHHHAPGEVRVGVDLVGDTVGGPAGVADARLAGERPVHQKVGKVHKFAYRAAAL